MNKDEILALSRVSKDFWFSNYYYIPVVGKGAQLFKPRPYQNHIAKRIDTAKLIIGLKARQIGWTTIGVASAVHDALFNEEHPWLFVSKNEDAAQKMLAKAKYAYQRLPAWMKKELPNMIGGGTQTMVEFENGSRLESVPATPSTGRSDAVYGTLMDECAFMEYAEEIWGAIEPLTYGVSMLFSTANGMGNFFHDIWLDSQQSDSVWEGLFYPWNVVPERDEAWHDHARRSFRGREWLFYQEYASTPEEAFARSGRVAFGMDIVDECFEEIQPYAKYAWEIGGWDREEGPYEIDLHEEADIEVYMWKPPEVVRDEVGRPIWKPNYVIGADVAEGLDHGDFTYVTVWDANTGEQVLSSKSAIPVSYLDELLDWCGRTYHTGLIIVEHNMAGVLPLDRLHRDRWYPRLYRMDSFAQYNIGDRTARYGWQTSKQTKSKMVNDFYYALAEHKVLLHDPDFRVEAQTFVADGKGSYAATAGRHDDVVMGTLIAYQGVLDSPKYPITWVDDRILPPTHDEMDAIWYGDDSKTTNADLLEVPLGGREERKPTKTILFTPANFGDKT